MIQAKIRFGTWSWRYSLQVVIQLNIFYPNNWKFSTWICFLSEKTVSFNQTPLQESTDCHSNASWKVTHEFPSKEKYWLCQWTLPVVQHCRQSFAMWCYQKTQAQTKIWEISFNEKNSSSWPCLLLVEHVVQRCCGVSISIFKAKLDKVLATCCIWPCADRKIRPDDPLTFLPESTILCFLSPVATTQPKKR